MISVGAYVLFDGTRRALVESEGDEPRTWDISFDDDDTEAEAVPETRLVLDSTQHTTDVPPTADAALLTALSAGTDPRFARPPAWTLPSKVSDPDTAWDRIR